jgi:hypothetical protein
MKGFGPEPMITPELLAKWTKDFLKDNLLIAYGIFYVYILSNEDILETMKSSPYYRPWVNVSLEESEVWFPQIRCQNFEEKELFEILLEFWHQILILDGHLEVKFSKIDGLGLYTKVAGVEVKALKGKNATFLFEIGAEREMDDLKGCNFNSLYEYDGKVYGLYGLWSLANRSESVEVGFTNLKQNGQTLQSVLHLNTIKYVANENNKRMKKQDSNIEFKDIPSLAKYSMKNTQDINEEIIDSTPNGTTFKYITKSYKIVEIEPYFDSKTKVGHKLEKKGQQLFICYEDIEVEYEPEESQQAESSFTPSPMSRSKVA